MGQRDVGGAALAQGVPGPSGDAKQLGTLTCTASAPTSDPQVPASKETQFACTFEPIGTEGVKEYYVGSSTERLRDVGPAARRSSPGRCTRQARQPRRGRWREHTSRRLAGQGADPDRRGRKRLHTAAADRSRPERRVPTALDTLVLRRDRPRGGAESSVGCSSAPSQMASACIQMPRYTDLLELEGSARCIGLVRGLRPPSCWAVNGVRGMSIANVVAPHLPYLRRFARA